MNVIIATLLQRKDQQTREVTFIVEKYGL